MYRMTIEASSIEELTAKIAQLSVVVVVGEGRTAAGMGRVATAAPAEETAAEVASEKKPVGRPRKSVEGLGLPVDGTAAVPTPAPKVEKPKKYTLDQVRSALQTYAQKVDPDASVGILKVRELLAQFQSTKHVPCQKISEVQDQDYAALVAACGA